MSKLNISDSTNISMPVRNMLAIIGAVAMGVWAYFGITEQLNKHSTTLELMQKDLSENTEFRIKYPRGELGQSQNDLEQFMLIEDLYKSVEKMEGILENNMTNKVISLAFLVFVVYNFLNMRGLKGEIGALTDKNTELSGNLASTKSELVQAQADLETVKTDLVTAQQENEKRKAEVDRLKSQLKED